MKTAWASVGVALLAVVCFGRSAVAAEPAAAAAPPPPPTAAPAAAAAAAADVSAVVVDADGKPVPNADVVVIRQVNDPGTREFAGVEELARTRAGADGTFRIAVPPPPADRARVGLDFVRATADGHAYGLLFLGRMPDGSVRTGNYLTARGRRGGGDADPPTIVLPPATALTGTVTDGPDGKPVAGATVVYRHLTAPVTTGADGRFAIDKVAPAVFGAYERFEALIVRHPDFAEQVIELRGDRAPTAGKPLDLPVFLDPGVLVTGRITEESTGKPIPGCVVVAEGSRQNPRSVHTDADGRYALRLPDDGLLAKIHVLAGWTADGKSIANLYPVGGERMLNGPGRPPGKVEGPVTHDFVMAKGQVIAGVARPKPGAAKLPDDLLVDLHPADRPGSWRTFWKQRQEEVDPDGSFRFERMMPGTYTLTFTAGDGSPQGNMTVELAEEQENLAVEFTLNPPVRVALTGRVVGPDGKPAADVRVDARPTRNLREDAAMQAAPPQPQSQPLAAGEKGRRARRDLPRPSRPTIAARPVSPRPVVTGADGTFRFENLDPEFELQLQARTADGTLGVVRAIAGAEALAKPVELKLGPGAEVVGTILDGDGKPIRDISVLISEEMILGPITRMSSIALARTDEQGRYRFANIFAPAGQEKSLIVTTSGNPNRFAPHGLPTRPGGVRGLDLSPGQKHENVDFRISDTDAGITIEPVLTPPPGAKP